MAKTLPTLAALEAKDDGQLSAELGLARLRTQAAVVRSVADHAERLARSVDFSGLEAQLVEEMAHLGCRLLEAAGSLSRLSATPTRPALARCTPALGRTRRRSTVGS